MTRTVSLSRSRRGAVRGSSALIAALLCIAARPAAATCPGGADESTVSCIDHDPKPNVILFLADDLGWADLPFFSPPIDYDAAGTFQDRDGFEAMRPDRNRLAARMMARRPDEASPGSLGQFQRVRVHPGAAATPYAVKPSDHTPVPAYSTSSADDETHVVRGYGGLRRIFDSTGSSGVSFSRYYATSGVCAPTRGTIFTGRHVQHTGVEGNNPRPSPAEITIAEYLTRDCGTSGDLCYKTGLIGKWHFGHGEGLNPWEQGFNEFLGHPRGCCRGHFGRRPLECSPGLEICERLHPEDPLDDEWIYDVTGRGDRRPEDQQPCSTDARNNCSGGIFHGQPCRLASDCGSGTCAEVRVCTGTSNPCNDDDDCGFGSRCGCNFSVRLYRDLAVNFIRRHLASPRADDPFFLVVSFNAMHAGHNAPIKTQAHYTTGPKSSRPKYWGLLEEVDATVGDILDEVKARGLDDRTVVFFTTDQGSPGGAPGNPALRGGKSGVYEGGVRVGLLGRACNCSGVDLTPLGPHVASHVDLFPTIAEAAGHPLPTPVGAGGVTQVGYCQNPSGTVCTENADCTPDDCGGYRSVDGKSFYSLLVAGGQPTPMPARNFAYAKYGAFAVAARPGAAVVPSATPIRLCGYAGDNADRVPVRGGSCATCQTTCPNGTACRLLGKVCLAPNQGTCQGTGTPCDGDNDPECGSRVCVVSAPSQVAPCINKCAPGKSCVEAHVTCNTCVEAAWKLRAPVDPEGAPAACPATPDLDDQVYDLATNPEEDERLDCSEQGGGIFDNVWCRLKQRLVYWDQCGQTAACEQQAIDCQDLLARPSCIPP